MKLLLITNEIRAADVIRFLSVSRATASRMLSKLVKQGVLIKVNRGRQQNTSEEPEHVP